MAMIKKIGVLHLSAAREPQRPSRGGSRLSVRGVALFCEPRFCWPISRRSNELLHQGIGEAHASA